MKENVDVKHMRKFFAIYDDRASKREKNKKFRKENLL